MPPASDARSGVRRAGAVRRRSALRDSGTLPERLWAGFARRHWEREATVLESVTDGPLVPPEELFPILVTASERCRRGEPAEIVFFLGPRKVEDCGHWLPTAGDGSIPGYIERVLRHNGDTDFTVLLANPHLLDRALWRRTRRFLRGLHRHGEIACGGVDTGIFLGRYRRTPFGVHRGQMSVMTFPSLGAKHFRLWRRGYGEAHADVRDSLDYQRHVPESFELTARVGDVMYWPADVWHIAEGDQDYTAALNVGFWWDRPPLARVMLRFGQLVAEADDEPSDGAITLPPGASLPRGTRAGVPAPLLAALRSARRVAAGAALERALELEWLAFVSGDGFRDVPEALPSASIALHADDVVQAEPDEPILRARGRGGELYVAANGHAFTLADTAPVRALLARLDAGEALRVGEARALARQRAGVDLPGLLRFLLSVRALRLHAGDGAQGAPRPHAGSRR